MTPEYPVEDTALVEHSPTAHCVLRGKTVVYANAAMGRLFDVEPAALQGSSLAEFVAADDRERVTDSLLVGGAEPVTVRFDLAGGDRDPVTVESEWVVRGADGARELVGSLREITDRVERERELERESEMLDSLLSNIPMSIYFKDRQSRHERVSTHLVCQDADSCITNDEGKMHPHPDDVLGKTDWDIYGPDLAEGAVEEDRDILDREEPIFNEVTETRTNLGETFFTSTTKAPRYDEDGDVVGIVGVTMDVTERLCYERELERHNERLEEFTEVLAHDLRNPLTVARGHVGVLAEDYDHESVEKVDESLERISTLIDEIRSFVIEGRTVEDPDTVDLSTLAREAWESVDTGDASLEVPATHTIEADRDRLRRLLENVYRNAVEHACPDSEGATDCDALTVTVGDLDDGFFVADDGPGIPDERKDDVFQRGFTTGADGTGFGLAIVRNIAEAHDWTVGVTDAERREDPEAGGDPDESGTDETDASGADPPDDSRGAQFEFGGVVRVEADANEHF